MYCFAADGTGTIFRDRLAAAAIRGVAVSVLADAVGSVGTPTGFWQPLHAAGAAVKLFRPLRRGILPFRDHRKLVLIDGEVAYLGGLNIADQYGPGAAGESPWRDNALRVTGQGLAVLEHSFRRMWRRADRPLRPSLLIAPARLEAPLVPAQRVAFLESGPEGPYRPLRQMYLDLIRRSDIGLDLAMGYFFPTGKVLREIRRAVRRGVRIRVLLPAEHADVPLARWASRGIYGVLLKAGVEVWEYLPTMLHAKMLISDDTLVIGSANLDIRSERLNYELVALVRDEAVVGDARAQFDGDLLHSRRMTLDEWRRRPWVQKLKERVSHFIVARLDLFFSRWSLIRRKW
jgi:cardiolipin synthase